MGHIICPSRVATVEVKNVAWREGSKSAYISYVRPRGAKKLTLFVACREGQKGADGQD